MSNSRACHVLYDVWVPDSTRIARVDPLERLCLDAACEGGATVLFSRFEQFEPAGVTGFVLLAESHLSVHTWVAESQALVDILTCGALDVAAMLAVFRTGLNPIRERCRTLDRG